MVEGAKMWVDPLTCLVLVALDSRAIKCDKGPAG